MHTRPWTSYACAASHSCPRSRPWIIRPNMGIVSRSTSSIRPARCDCWREVMPRSERAKLIDLVKFSGTVAGSRRSTDQEKFND